MSTFKKNIHLGTIDPLYGTEDIADKAITEAKLSDAIKTKINNTVPEAPKDDKQYARKNGAWSEVEVSYGKGVKAPFGGILYGNETVKHVGSCSIEVNLPETIYYYKNGGYFVMKYTAGGNTLYYSHFSIVEPLSQSVVLSSDMYNVYGEDGSTPVGIKNSQFIDIYTGKILADMIGDLSGLATTAKGSVVAAINEVKGIAESAGIQTPMEFDAFANGLIIPESEKYSGSFVGVTVCYSNPHGKFLLCSTLTKFVNENSVTETRYYSSWNASTSIPSSDEYNSEDGSHPLRYKTFYCKADGKVYKPDAGYVMQVYKESLAKTVNIYDYIGANKGYMPNADVYIYRQSAEGCTFACNVMDIDELEHLGAIRVITLCSADSNDAKDEGGMRYHTNFVFQLRDDGTYIFVGIYYYGASRISTPGTAADITLNDNDQYLMKLATMDALAQKYDGSFDYPSGTLGASMGKLSSLTTTNKSNLVAAINEVKGIAERYVLTIDCNHMPSCGYEGTSVSATYLDALGHIGEDFQIYVKNLKYNGKDYTSLRMLASFYDDSIQGSALIRIGIGTYRMFHVVYTASGLDIFERTIDPPVQNS